MISCALTGRQILLKFSKIKLVYLAARDKYHLEREDKAGEGYMDFIFIRKKENADTIILELKIDRSNAKIVRFGLKEKWKKRQNIRVRF